MNTFGVLVGIVLASRVLLLPASDNVCAKIGHPKAFIRGVIRVVDPEVQVGWDRVGVPMGTVVTVNELVVTGNGWDVGILVGQATASTEDGSFWLEALTPGKRRGFAFKFWNQVQMDIDVAFFDVAIPMLRDGACFEVLLFKRKLTDG